MKQKEYNTNFQTAINGLQAQQYVDRLAESWEAGNIFQGYHPVIQTPLFIDCVLPTGKTYSKTTHTESSMSWIE